MSLTAYVLIPAVRVCVFFALMVLTRHDTNKRLFPGKKNDAKHESLWVPADLFRALELYASCTSSQQIIRNHPNDYAIGCTKP